ncbi:hypothetical protein Ancab_016769 [Ancistrocladus abbreviatus]
MQQGDFNSSYYPYRQPLLNPNPNPIDDHQQQPPAPPPPPPPAYASAPPFSSTTYLSAEYPAYNHNYSQLSQNPDPISSLTPPTAPPSSYPLPPTNPVPNPPSQPSSTPTSQYFAQAPLPLPEVQAAYPPPPVQQQPPPPLYPPYDPHQPVQPSPSYSAPSTALPSNAYFDSNSTSNSSMYSAPFSNVNSSVPSVYESSPYESTSRSDRVYYDDTSRGCGSYERSRSDLGSDLYGKRQESSRYNSGIYRDDGYGDGVYAYEGKTEPYGARGTSSKSSTWSGLFDDYGRAISFPSEKDKSSSLKVVKAVPKADTQTDVKSGVQKFRVKLLPEGGGQSVMDVLCQVGLDGVRMLDPSTSRTLRIYPLETVTRCEKFDSSTFAFWSKTSVDIEPRRIRLQSNGYTTNTILDTVTAAVVQFKEMGGRSSRPADSLKVPEQAAEKKKGLGDWMNLLKPANEEKDHWVPDEAVSKCTACGTDFSAFVRKHHCRNCGDIFCDKCTHGRIALTADENAQPVRVCDRCMAEVTQRLSNAKEAANKPAVQSHEDLAKKLQDEMEKNRRAASGSKSDGSGKRMKEVACPTCTVHLQVQVPSSGSETIECGVCQHPFLVSAH